MKINFITELQIQQKHDGCEKKSHLFAVLL
jgi:hypothetical protein